MDSWQFNKIAGAVLGTIFLMFGGSLIAEGIFHSEAPETPGYEIVVAEGGEGGESGGEEATVAPIAARMQEADAAAGESDFRKCSACHSADESGENKIGPGLWNVVNRPIASHEGFSYSQAMSSFSEGGSVVWDYEHLDQFLANPKGYIDGTAMGFAGIRDPQDRADTIAYLRSLASEPAALPEPPAEGEEAAEAEEGGEGEEVEASGAATQSSESDEDMNAQAAGTTDPDTASSMPGQDQAPVASDEAQPETQANEVQESGDDFAAAGGVQFAGDPAAGESVFRKCQACHKIGEGASNGIGPELNGVMGEKPGDVEGYSFSSNFQEWASDKEQWDPELMTTWLSDPRGTVQGTKMAFAGIKDEDDLNNVIAYLATFAEDGSKQELPSGSGGGASESGDGSDGASAGEDQSGEDASGGSEEEANAASDGGEEQVAAADQAASSEAEGSGDNAEASSGEEASANAGGEAEGSSEEAASGDQAAASESEGEETAEAATAEGESGGEAVEVAGDPAAGESVFRRCQACHKIGEGARNGIGPELNGVMGEKPGDVEGYSFSSNFQDWASDKEQWNAELMTTWLSDPRGTVQGTKMAFAGLKSQEDIDNVIAYLSQFAEDGSKSGN
ncbi:c-type cytochrome [Fulvimarina sp. MAC8]|uniref:c-type cytochrome n=1 Tax=Fulvimarina sp. MAC8 TaxID=3162874 RepID=UPI0032EBC0F9